AAGGTPASVKWFARAEKSWIKKGSSTDPTAAASDSGSGSAGPLSRRPAAAIRMCHLGGRHARGRARRSQHVRRGSSQLDYSQSANPNYGRVGFSLLGRESNKPIRASSKTLIAW